MLASYSFAFVRKPRIVLLTVFLFLFFFLLEMAELKDQLSLGGANVNEA